MNNASCNTTSVRNCFSLLLLYATPFISTQFSILFAHYLYLSLFGALYSTNLTNRSLAKYARSILLYILEKNKNWAGDCFWFIILFTSHCISFSIFHQEKKKITLSILKKLRTNIDFILHMNPSSVGCVTAFVISNTFSLAFHFGRS